MERTPECFENMIWVVVLLMIPYALTIFIHSAIEFEAPFMHILLPATALCSIVFVIWAVATNQQVLRSFEMGVLIGLAVYLVLFTSNFLFDQPLNGEYSVREVSEGRSSRVYWRVDTPERKNVELALNIVGVNVNSNPKDVPLTLRVGWLGYYYGE